ncbi:hypothetical protein FSP39_018534 [Pinctada imbricata]|uniref:Endonuclease n=1 Tax=Pinctada imbricata TaxID=66713 RepID=A0AA88Y8X5_PINIB|nr:hypothetical protein FSP39_018534 [Pinctada imbricata]
MASTNNYHMSFEAATIETAIVNNNKVHIQIHNTTTQALVDTGASISVISLTALNKAVKHPKIQSSKLISVSGVCATIHRVCGQITLPINIDGYTFSHTFQILDIVNTGVILGADFLRENNAIIDLQNHQLIFNDIKHVTALYLDEREQVVGLVKTITANNIPPNSEFNIQIKVTRTSENSLVLLEPSSFLAEHQLIGGRCLTRIKDGSTYYRILNPTNSTINIKKNKLIAKAYPVDENCIYTLDTNDKISTSSLHANTNSCNKPIDQDLDIHIDKENLTHNEQLQLAELLTRNRDVFAKDASELGKTHIHYHRIDTVTDKPVRSKPYKQTPAARQETDKQIEHMLQHDIIEESTSNYHSPVVLVKKKNGSFRFAVDFRKLNAATESMSFPIPRVDEVFDTIAESKAQIFSVLDLASGFWQVPLDEETKHKTAFITHKGLYQFKRMPFGLMNAPMTYQMLMTKVLKDLNWRIALIYIDDVLVYSKSVAEHFGHLELVFQKLREANLTLQPSKCHFAATTVKYLGHVISNKGIKVDSDKTAAVATYPVPKSIKHVRSFLGMCNYYRKFIKNYSKIAAPLSRLLCKDSKFRWTDECTTAFNTLKAALTSAPILAYPDFSRPFVLSTDASEEAIGYILGQVDPNTNLEHVIAYGGRSLHAAEKRWHINEKEGLALIDAIKTFKPYLSNAKFTVYTDNITVRWLNNNKDASGRLGRWSLFLQSYNFDIVHRAGSKNNADALSRRPYSECTTQEDPKTNSPRPPISTIEIPAHHDKIAVTFEYDGERNSPATINLMETSINAIQHPHTDVQDNPLLSHLQMNDSDFIEIVRFITAGELPDNHKHANTVYIQSQHYHISNGLLYHLHQDRGKGLPPERSLIRQLAVPKSLRKDVLDAYHDCIAGGGHQGFDRTLASIKAKYYWPRMYTDIEEYIRTCETCQQSKRPIHNRPAPLTPIPTEELFSRWHMDILELPCTSEGYRYLLLVVDSFSRYPEAFPLKSQEAPEVARVLFNEIFSRWGAPRTLISDRGQNFMSKLVQALCELFDCSQTLY